LSGELAVAVDDGESEEGNGAEAAAEGSCVRALFGLPLSLSEGFSVEATGRAKGAEAAAEGRCVKAGLCPEEEAGAGADPPGVAGEAMRKAHPDRSAWSNRSSPTSLPKAS
jgi:hypothetical protein